MRSINLLDENLRLWNEFRSGDADAFGELIRIHYQDLFNYGTRFTRDEELVKGLPPGSISLALEEQADHQ